jgi:trehalose-phosphatase
MFTLPKTWSDEQAESWWGRLAVAPHSVLMLDYDGTLAPFVEDRMRATLYPGVATRLVKLRQLAKTRLVFVSGRAAQELPMLLPAGLNAEIWGSHGCEHALPNGVLEVLSLTTAQTEGLALLGREMSDAGYEAAIERKPGSLAIHLRGLTEYRQQHLRETAEGLFAKMELDPKSSTSLEWLPFDGGVEVRSPLCSKALAVKRILDEEPAETVIAYLGDDQTDEDAFRALTGRGLRVLVRTELRASLADIWIRPPSELLAFLDRFLATVSQQPNY